MIVQRLSSKIGFVGTTEVVHYKRVKSIVFLIQMVLKESCPMYFTCCYWDVLLYDLYYISTDNVIYLPT